MSQKTRILTETEARNELVAQQRTPDPVADACRAWTDDTGRPAWHATRQTIIRREMPLLADALDRLTTPAKK